MSSSLDSKGDVPLPKRASSIKYSEPTLRQRKPTSSSQDTLRPEASDKENEDSGDDVKEKEDVMWGKTPSGVVFKAPPTHSFLHTLLTTFTRSSLTRLTLISLLLQPVIFFLLSSYPTLRSTLFLLYFAFWRGAYDIGFAWVLRKQSEKKWIVRSLKAWGWLDVDSESGGEVGREWARWWKRELEMKMGEGYRWEGVPAEFNSWLIFRQLVDIVLLNDFVSYSLFAWSNLHWPTDHSVPTHILRWILGWSLIFFNLWVKIDAHRVVKDYAWYWGDAFWLMVMQDDLVFDGVYEIAPHPMYSVGYAGYYGLSIVVASYAVFFVSLVAHAAQFAFLLWFENPHIERTYGGGKKPLASRVPINVGSSPQPALPVPEEAIANDSGFTAIIDDATPAGTEGETETEPELPELPTFPNRDPVIRNRSDSSLSVTSSSSTPVTGISGKPINRRAGYKRTKSISMHDLTNRFFRKPVVVLSRLDIYRATDFALILLVSYALTSLIPALSPGLALTAHFLHALSWRLFHSFGLGLLLRAQSKSKWLVRHYLKHYHYPGQDEEFDGSEGEELKWSSVGSAGGAGGTGSGREGVVKRATEEAFGNWQVGYNISLVMTYVSFAGLAWKTYHLPMDWTVSGTILRHILGLSLIALHVWSAVSSYEVLGDFGWLYSDFFLLEEIPSQLAYTGIYRFLNNPERSMGGAAFLGLSLISNSALVFVLAVVSHLSHWWFLSSVERPHMKRLYGDRLRQDGGLTKTLKSVAGKSIVKNAAKHAPEISRVVREVRGSIEKVEEKVTEAVEDFLDHARPRFSEVVNETKILLQQSRERMIITRVASDISSYDTSRYSLALPTTSTTPTPRYTLGQPIKVSWTAPHNHSRKDWIGIYRLGSCKSQLVTRISSVGKWMPLYEEEWDGDIPVTPVSPASVGDAGIVTFRGDQLPWTPGSYEMRYHHDGKHNVLSRVAPIEIYVSKPADPTSYRSVHSTMLNIVCLSLDSDPKLIPRSAKPKSSRTSSSGTSELNLPTLSSLTLTPKDTPPTSKTPTPSDLDPEKEQRTESPTPSSPELINHPIDDPSDISKVEQEEQDEDDQVTSPDDFTLMDEKQAKRIVSLANLSFDVELSTDVVIADANVGALARRVLGARSLVGGGS